MKLYSNISCIFFIWLISILFISYLGFFTLPHSGNFSNNFWESFKNWDGGHYLGIAEIGYSQKFQYAFFPLYPLAVKALNSVIGNFLLTAILISITAAFLGIQLLYKLIMLDFGRQTAEKAVLALLFFPTSFFLLTIYSESLFFLLTVSSFYFLRQNKLFWAAVFAALASSARLAGLAVVAGFLIEVMIMQGFNRKNWFVIFAPLGFLLYCLFLYQQTGDPFYFITAENHWQRTLTMPGTGFWEALKNVLGNGLLASNFNILIDLLFAVFGVGLAIRSFRFLPLSFAIFALMAIGIPLFTPTLTSMPRFLLPVFPIFILIALIKNNYFQLFFRLISLMLLGIFTVFFINGYWVA